MKRIIIGECDTKTDENLYFNDHAQLLEFLDHCDDDVALVDSRLMHHIDWNYVQALKLDFVHCGLSFASKEYFEILNFCSTSWFFLHSSPLHSAVSWKATAHFIYIRKNRVKQVGGIDRQYDSIHAAMADLAYRILKAGGSVQFNPHILRDHSSIVKDVITSSLNDQLHFIYKFIGRSALLYTKFFYLFNNPFQLNAWKAFMRSQKSGSKIKSSDLQNFDLTFAEKVKTVNTYTAIIPTINRYDYLDKAIQSLIETDFPPAEIIVVDQTPMQNRIAGYYDSFLKREDVKVVFLDTAGQSISRNTAIDMASHEWIYMFDDDSVCWKECMREHRFLVEHSLADCSTGLSLAPWKDVTYIDSTNSYYRLVDVLDTGNCFIKKATLTTNGKLDSAFNKGPGVDDDLGRRLFLAGYNIVLNPKAIRTHYKAKSGGLRQYGAWWNNKTTILGEFPPATKAYSIQKFYKPKFRIPLYLQYFLAAKKRHSTIEFFLLWILAPYKLAKSISKAKELAKISNIPRQ
ncbi:MAG: glycosyltransferase family A protein [Chryseolinea sp.]